MWQQQPSPPPPAPAWQSPYANASAYGTTQYGYPPSVHGAGSGTSYASAPAPAQPPAFAASPQPFAPAPCPPPTFQQPARGPVDPRVRVSRTHGPNGDVPHVEVQFEAGGLFAPPSVRVPLDVSPLLRGRVDPKRYFATLNKCNQILQENGIGSCNWACLLCPCVGLCYASQRNEEAERLLKAYLAGENNRIYGELGMHWHIMVESHTMKNEQGHQQTVFFRKWLQLDVIPAREEARAAEELKQQVQAQAAQLNHLHSQMMMQREEPAAAAAKRVEIVVPAGGPFQVLNFGELQIVREIGSGSFGTVFSARWRGSDVVVKKLRAELATAAVVGDFLAEAQLCERVCRHPNVVRFIGATTKLPDLCLVFEYLPNGSLENVLFRQKRFASVADLPRLVQIAEDCAAGVLHLHEESVVHRDIAARNVLLDELFRARVSDFGMSRVKESEDRDAPEHTASVVGPLKWMAPESLARKEYSTKSDVWMFGVLLFEIFVRRPPWPGIDNLEAALRVRQGETMHIPDSVPKPIAKLMAACWAREPEKRPSMAQVHRSLQAFKQAVTAIKPGSPQAAPQVLRVERPAQAADAAAVAGADAGRAYDVSEELSAPLLSADAASGERH